MSNLLSPVQSAPDPLRLRYRRALNELMQLIVLHGRTLGAALPEVQVAAVDVPAFVAIANTELDQLEPYNAARYNLARASTQRWIDGGRTR